KLNLQSQCIVKFEEKFFKPIYEFLISYDTIPRIYNSDDILTLPPLPPDNDAHEMLDQ
ncbi:7013_t:CDS:1, partial [Funneliformis geosporum]